MTGDLSHLLQAIRRDPADDTLRLACADELANQPTTYRRCPKCVGTRRVDYRKPSGVLASKTCSCGSGQVADTEYADWAELVRVQVELKRWPCECDSEERVYHDECRCSEKNVLARRSVALLAARPHWQAVTCPGCEGTGTVDLGQLGYGPCGMCSRSGALPVVVERGFARRLVLPTMDSVGEEVEEEKEIECPYCEDAPVCPETNVVECSRCDCTGVIETETTRRFHPNPALAELVRGNVWLRTVREVEVRDRVPHHSGAGFGYCWYDADRDISHAARLLTGVPPSADLPTTVFQKIKDFDTTHTTGERWKPFPTAEATNMALWEVVAELVRGEI